MAVSALGARTLGERSRRLSGLLVLGLLLYVIPSLELTIAVTSDPTRPARSAGYVGDLRALVAEEIVPAVAPG